MSQTKNRSCLIVDNSKVIRLVLKKNLGMLGLGFEKILEAENGQQALELFQKEPTDLLLTDLHMPVMDGHQLLKEMAARGLFGKVKVGVVTAEPNLDIHRELLALGAKWVIQKPFTPEMFRQGIQNILA